MNGLELIEQIIGATGLPKETVRAEFQRLANAHSIDLETVKLDKLRELMAAYLQDVLLAQLE